MAWYAIIRKTNDELVSVASVIPEVLDDAFEYRLLASKPDLGTVMWDQATADFVPMPPKVFIDRFDEFVADPDLQPIWTVLKQDQKNKVETAMDRLLGNKRMRYAGNPYQIE